MNEIQKAALDYAALGLHVIPVDKDKKPHISWLEYKEKKPDEATINSWWEAFPNANVGIILGRGTFALDLDDLASLGKLSALGIDIPADTPTAATSRGLHYFFSGTAPDRVALLPGIDVRGSGYVVAAPSLHLSGARYTWLRPLHLPLPEAPPALLALINTPKGNGVGSTGGNGSVWLLEALGGVGEGQRDVACTRLAGYFLGKGIPVEAAQTLLYDWAKRCTPPFDEALVDKCITSIARREGPIDVSMPTIADSVDKTLKRLYAPPEARPKPVASRLANLDFMLDGGFQPGELVYFGARPGVGKTTLALQVARATAKAGRGVIVVSREMTKEQLTRRMLVQESYVSASAVKLGLFTAGQRGQLDYAGNVLRNLPMWLFSGANVESAEGIKDVLNMFAPGVIGLVVIDYLQLLHAPKDIRDRRLQVEHVSQSLKNLAINQEIPVLCLSSLTRPPHDASPRWRPRLSDLRESGELEHDADIVLLGWRGTDDATRVELNVEKNRDGRTGVVYLNFDADHLTFSEGTKPDDTTTKKV